jgi:nitroreductase
MQNLHLSASAVGLAGYWSTPPLVYTPQFAQWLSIRPEDRCLGLFYLGWPKAGLSWPESPRHPIAEKIQWLGEPA